MTVVNGTIAYRFENGEDVYDLENLVCKLITNNQELFEIEAKEERKPNKTKAFELTE